MEREREAESGWNTTCNVLDSRESGGEYRFVQQYLVVVEAVL